MSENYPKDVNAYVWLRSPRPQVAFLDFDRRHAIKQTHLLPMDVFTKSFSFPYRRFLKDFEVVPTSFSGHVEFYGYFKSEEDNFNRFVENLKVSCSYRSTMPQCLAVDKIYAMPVLLRENEDIREKKLEKVWTRVKCTKIFNREFILADLLETGETSRKVLIKNLITIPGMYNSTKIEKYSATVFQLL